MFSFVARFGGSDAWPAAGIRPRWGGMAAFRKRVESPVKIVKIEPE
jgi:hypothetical protein